MADDSTKIDHIEEMSHSAIGGDVIAGNKTVINNIYNLPSSQSGATHEPAKPAKIGSQPYRGLAAFLEQDVDFFFGRKQVVEELATTVEEQSFVAVIGVSGSGKSSVVFAGLVPHLRSTNHWLIASLRPRAQPFLELATALVRWLYQDKLVQAEKLDEFSHKLRDGSLPLNSIFQLIQHNKYPNQRLLLIVDQFEELYTLTADKVLQQRFIDVLLQSLSSPHCVLLITLRADFMGQALAHDTFAQVLDRYRDKKLGRMTDQELTLAIECPAAQLGVKLAEGLTQRILGELGQEPGNLPLLEFVLTQLWEQQQYQQLTHEAYQAMGGVNQALAHHADTVLQQLPPEQRSLLRKVMVQLVRPGEGTEDIRKVATRQQLGENNWSLVKQLADKRLVVTGYYEETQQETVEVVHEALIRYWQPLKQWMNEDRKFRVWQEDLRRYMKDKLLLREIPLAEAQKWLEERKTELSEEEQEFIQRSIAQQQEEQAEKERQAQLLQEQKNKALISQSLILSYIANQHVENSPFTAIRLLFESLPNLSESIKERPEVKEIYQVLFDAINQYRLGIIEHDDSVDFSEFSPDGNFLLSYGGHTAYLWRFPNFYLHATLLGHQDKIWSAAFSSDSKWIVTGSEDKTALLWEVETGKQIYTLQGHTARVRSAAFSHDNKYVVTASFDGSVRLWEIETGQQLAILQEKIGKIWSVTFTPDNKHILISSDKFVLRWEIESQEKYVVTGSDKRFNILAKPLFSKDVVFLIKQSDMFVSTVFLVKGKEIITITSYLDMNISNNSIATNSSNSWIATSSSEHTVHVWNIETRQLIFTAQKHDKAINSIVFDKNDKFILTASEDKKAILWNIQEGKQHAILEGHTHGINSAHFSPDSKYVVTASQDKTIRLWHVNTGKSISIYKTAQSELNSYIAFSPDGRYLAENSGNNIYLWQVEDDRLKETVITFSGHTKTVNEIAWSSNNKYLASASQDGTAIVWDITTGKIVNTLKQHKDALLSVTFSRDNKLLVTTSKDKTACVWKTETGELLNVLRGHTEEVKSASFDMYSNDVFTVSKDKTIRVWNVQTGLLIHTLTEHTDGINSIALSPNGKYIATVSSDKTCIIWETSTNTIVQRLFGHTESVKVVIFHPNDEIVITGADSTVRFWKITTGKQSFQLNVGHWVNSLSLSPDKKYIAVELFNGNIRLGHLFENIDEMITYAKRILPPSSQRPDSMRLTCEERKKFFLEELDRCKE